MRSAVMETLLAFVVGAALGECAGGTAERRVCARDLGEWGGGCPRPSPSPVASFKKLCARD